jgi:hypothetical protein
LRQAGTLRALGTSRRNHDAFHRIETTIKDGDEWRVLDLKRADVRAAIARHSGEVLALYKTSVAALYG